MATISRLTSLRTRVCNADNRSATSLHHNWTRFCPVSGLMHHIYTKLSRCSSGGNFFGLKSATYSYGVYAVSTFEQMLQKKSLGECFARDRGSQYSSSRTSLKYSHQMSGQTCHLKYTKFNFRNVPYLAWTLTALPRPCWIWGKGREEEGIKGGRMGEGKEMREAEGDKRPWLQSTYMHRTVVNVFTVSLSMLVFTSTFTSCYIV